jgi:Flp pilus assembly pilin Flp
MTSKLINTIRKFHRDEEGLEALQVVMIIAIAAMVMVACATVGQKTTAWMNQQWTSLQGTSISADGSGGGTDPNFAAGSALINGVGQGLSAANKATHGFLP